MEINGVISPVITYPLTQPEPAAVEEPVQPPAPVEEITEPPIIEEPATPEEENEIPGVLRNLMNGHYKGVADVRLRLVHADKLKALEEAQFQETMENETGVLADFDEKLAELLTYAAPTTPPEEPPTSGEPAEVIDTTVPDGEPIAGDAAPVPEGIIEPAAAETVAEGIFEAVTEPVPEIVTEPAAEEPDAAEVLTPEQEMYATLASGQIGDLLEFGDASKEEVIGMIEELETTIGDLLGALTPPPPTETEVVDPATEITPPAAEESLSPLEELVGSFIDPLIPDLLASLEGLKESLGTSALPEISEPKGKGKAYDKFLDMLNEMSEPQEDTEVTETVDIVA